VLGGQAGIGLASLAGGFFLVVLARRPRTLASLAWVGWAGLATGLAAAEVLSQELLNVGLVGLIIAAMGGFLGSLTMFAGMESATAHFPTRRAGESAGGDTNPLSHSSLRLLRIQRPPLVIAAAAAGFLLLAATMAAAGLQLLVGVGTVVLLTIILADITSWPISFSLFAGVSVISALEVIVGRLIFSPLSIVGATVPAVLVLVLPMTALIIGRPRLPGFRSVLRRLCWIDLVAGIAALAAGGAWAHVFKGQDRFEVMAQLSQLGEDNNAHLLMLEATERSQTALGASPDSLSITSNFRGYFPGPSLWQSAFGAFLPKGPVPQLYVTSTAILLAVLAGLVTASAAFVSRRMGVLATLPVLGLAAIGTRLMLAQYEFGFPGQLLSAIWLVTAFVLVLVVDQSSTSDKVLTSCTLVALCLATWWTWSLAAPLLLLPVVIFCATPIAEKLPLRARWVLAATALAIGTLGALIARHRIRSVLDTLDIDGPVFRAVPMWFALLLIALVPLAIITARRRLSLSVSSLGLGTGLATLGLTAWQLFHLGHLTYYSYKLEYLALAIGWISTVLLVAAVATRAESKVPRIWSLAGIPVLLIIAIPVAMSASHSYEAWLAQRGALTPGVSLTCAERAAGRAPGGSVALAVGFGSPTADYLTTKALIDGSVSDASVPFFTPIFSGSTPETWPWTTGTSYVLVPGPADASAQRQAILAAARDAGAHIRVAASC
jgi:hypothetical protein